MVPTLVKIDFGKPASAQKGIHNRFHPDIPVVASIEPGQIVKVECIDYSGGQVGNNDCADDILDLDHSTDHALSGPFNIVGAEPGDTLAVEVLDVQPSTEQPWGYSYIAPGVGSIDDPNDQDADKRAAKSIWDFHGSSTSSRHIPGVEFQSRAHPGVLATAPSAELLAAWTKRECELVNNCPHTFVAPLPEAVGAFVNQDDLPEELRQRIYREGARTGPSRETAGNIDVGSLVAGSTMYLPVFVPGAKLSVGDLHFSEADGEPTAAIEMAGILTMTVSVIKRGVKELGFTSPVYMTSPREVIYRKQLTFTGICVSPNGVQHFSDATLAYQNACWSAMRYLMKFGYSWEQVYMLMATAPLESRVIATANKPNTVVSLGLPVEIFKFDIMPGNGPIVARDLRKPAALSPARLAAFLAGSSANGH
ncbi:Acetamidase/Formamidase [Cylindrobasidium torrendii FP15055 ss-10]|uniref:Acetamidase/Formamidase n=1 Tax=Cylindrobasidium torrendii FP15055 ss-10 TaxID=1314674 RepID=A0A0D7B1Y1_9AGAR|nr:Acetamidase/Formamidase [Cylindrobasidium torrendii FP15055 ss-10]